MRLLPQVTLERSHSWRSIAPYLIVAGVFALTVVPAAFVDPEPHHDGVQLAPAVAVAQGARVHADVYSQYGPITVWFHAAAVKVLGPYLLSIRLATALTILVSVWTMTKVLHKLRLGPAVAAVVPSVWLLLWPGWSVDAVTNPLLPWPSLLFLALQLLAVLCLLPNPEVRHARLLIGGVLLGLGAVTRPNYGVPLFLAWLILTLVFRERSAVRPVLFGFGIAVFSITLILLVQGALGAAVADSILGPLAGSATLGAASEWSVLLPTYVYSAPVLLAMLIAIWIWQKVPRRGANLLTVGATCAVATWSSLWFPGNPLRELILSKVTWEPALRAALSLPLYSAALLALVGGSFLLTYAVCMRPQVNLLQQQALFLAAVAFSSLSQLFPIADPQHLWWAAPPMLMFCALLFVGPAATRRQRLALSAVLAPVVALACVSGVLFWQTERSLITFGPARGMYATPDVRDSHSRLHALLRETKGLKGQFDCRDGLLPVWNGEYASSQTTYVNWVQGRSMVPPNFVVRCTETASEIPPHKQPPQLHLSYFSNYAVSVRMLSLEDSSPTRIRH